MYDDDSDYDSDPPIDVYERLQRQGSDYFKLNGFEQMMEKQDDPELNLRLKETRRLIKEKQQQHKVPKTSGKLIF